MSSGFRRICGFEDEKFSGDDFYTYSTQVRYTYDENGRILSRANYNLNRKKGEFELGGVYEYVYEGDEVDKVLEYIDGGGIITPNYTVTPVKPG